MAEGGVQLAGAAAWLDEPVGTNGGVKKLSMGDAELFGAVVSSAQSGRSTLCAKGTGSSARARTRWREQSYRDSRLETAPEPRSSRMLAVQALARRLSGTIVPVLNDVEVFLDDLERADLAERGEERKRSKVRRRGRAPEGEDEDALRGRQERVRRVLTSKLARRREKVSLGRSAFRYGRCTSSNESLVMQRALATMEDWAKTERESSKRSLKLRTAAKASRTSWKTKTTWPTARKKAVKQPRMLKPSH